jgi:hypothetical protein
MHAHLNTISTSLTALDFQGGTLVYHIISVKIILKCFNIWSRQIGIAVNL